MKLTNLVIPDSKNRSNAILKAFGKKDTSQLQKKQITNKSGHQQTVYVKGGLHDQIHEHLKDAGFKSVRKSLKKHNFDSTNVSDIHEYRHPKTKNVAYVEHVFNKEGKHVGTDAQHYAYEANSKYGRGRTSVKELHSGELHYGSPDPSDIESGKAKPPSPKAEKKELEKKLKEFKFKHS